MESFANDLVAFFNEIINLPPKTFATYIQIMFFPFAFFNSWTLDWDFKYFGAGLALVAFLFCYTMPSKEYSKNILMKWLLQIPMSKLMGLVSKGGILYLSLFWLTFGLLSFLPFSLFSGANSFIPHLKVMVYSFGTIYLTVSFCLMAEHLVMIAIRQVSILKAWKVTMAESKKLKNTLQNCHSRIEKGTKSKANETFWKCSKRYANFGVDASASFWPKLLQFQTILIVILIAYVFAYPLFCLSIVHL